MTLKRYLGLAVVAAALCLALSPELRAQANARVMWLADGTGNALTSTLEGSLRALHVVIVDPDTNLAVDYVVESRAAGVSDATTLRTVEATDSQMSAGVGATGDSAATAGSTGSISAKLRLITTNLSDALTALQLIDNNQTGASAFYKTAAGTTEDEHEVKGSAGVLYSVTITNTNAAARYWRCANQVAASTTPGTTTVYVGLAIPGSTAGAGFAPDLGPNGLAFSTGLTCWFVTGAADTDVAEVAANEIKATYLFK